MQFSQTKQNSLVSREILPTVLRGVEKAHVQQV